jgi:hypothetical protein
MSTAESRTPHRKTFFAKPLINNYLREIGEIGLDKRGRVHPLPVGTFHLDEESATRTSGTVCSTHEVLAYDF